MDRKARWMVIPRPFPPPTIAFRDSRAPRPRRARRARIRWVAVAGYALASMLAFGLAWLAVAWLR
jgi:hypothetical protein